MIRAEIWFAIAASIVLPGCQSRVATTQPYSTVDPKQLARAASVQQHHERAIELFGRHEFRDAETAVKKALEMDPRFGPAHNTLGVIYLHNGELYLAAVEFQYAIGYMRDRPEPHNNLGLVYERSGKLNLAVASFERAHRLSPDLEYVGNLVRAQRRLGDRSPEVIHMLQRIAEEDTRPDWIDWARRELGASYRASREAE